MNMFYGPGGGMDYMASADASRAQADAGRAKRHAESLEARLDRALLACEALWTILRDKLEITDLELVQRMNDLDLSDGQLDGKVRKTPVSCPSCGRAIARRFPKCMYCGQAVVHDPFA